jgi:hypothetical protein
MSIPDYAAKEHVSPYTEERKDGLDSLVPEKILKRYELDPTRRQAMLNELQLFGITESVLFPDLDGLAAELKQRFL